MATLSELYEKGVSRRNFLAGAGAISAATVLAGCSNNGTVTPTPTPTPAPAAVTDSDILNFALNLEYLEAEFYLRAATGTGLAVADTSGTGTQGAVTGGTKVTFATSYLQQYAVEIAQDELNHVRLLRSALGTAAVARPAIDLTFFAPLAVAAGITTPATFNPFADENQFLVGAFVFEDVGVTAYTGAAPLLSSSSILNTAAGIQAVEAYHAGEIRTIIAGMAAATGASQAYLSAANMVAMLRSKLGGGAETTLSVSQIVNDDSNALAFGRTTDQVLHIVTGSTATGVAKGGFFPAGLNGLINTATT